MKRSHAWMIVRAGVLILTLVLVGWFVIKTFTLTYPFWLAALFAWFLQPLVRLLQSKLRFSSGWASFVGLLGGVLVICGMITGLLFLLIANFKTFFLQIPNWIEGASINVQHFFNTVILPFWQDASGLFNSIGSGNNQAMKQGIMELGSQVGSILGDIGQGVVDWLSQLLLSLPTFFVAFIFFLLSIYFMGKDWGQYRSFFRRILPFRMRVKAKEFNFAIRNRLFGFIRAQFILMIATGIIVFIGLAILRVENIFTLAVIIGIAELLPYLGTGTILIPWSVYLLITGDVRLGVGIAIVYGVTLVVRQLLEPKVLSSSMDLNPVAVLISLFVGLQLFGAFGLFIGPVTLVLLIILHDIKITHSIYYFIRDGFQNEKAG